MSKQFPHLFTPGRIGNVEIKNRICKAPQTSGLSHMDGPVSERLVRYYEDLAKGEVGMIIVEYAYVDRLYSKSASNQLGICDDEYIVGLGWLADSIKNAGSVPCIQIEHCGRQRFLGPPMKSASPNPWPLMYQRYGQAAIPEELTIAEIHDIVEAFGKAAKRAKDAGFEVVEIHGAHGYLITNFLSPFTNQRTDWYGGSRENRFRFLEQIFTRCKEYVGEDFPLIVRLSGTDYEPGGMTIEDTIYYAKRLEELGCAAIDVSGGDHHQMIHQVTPMQLSKGHNVWAAGPSKKRSPSRFSPPVLLLCRSTPRRSWQKGKGTLSAWDAPCWPTPIGQKKHWRAIRRTSPLASAATRAVWTGATIWANPSTAP